MNLSKLLRYMGPTIAQHAVNGDQVTANNTSPPSLTWAQYSITLGKALKYKHTSNEYTFFKQLRKQILPCAITGLSSSIDSSSFDEMATILS